MGKIISFDDFSKRAKKLSEEDLILPISMGHSKPSNGHEKVDGDHQYYMFFQNLVSIKHYIDEILENNPDDIDACLKNGHDWAADHIATAKDDIQEVAEWLMSELHGDDMDQDDEEDDEEDDEDTEDEEGEDDDSEEEGSDEEDEEVEDEEGEGDDEEDDDYEEEEEVEEDLADMYDYRKRSLPTAGKKSGEEGDDGEDEEGEVIDESEDFEIDEDEEWEESEDFNEEEQEFNSDEEVYTEGEYEENEDSAEEESNDGK